MGDCWMSGVWSLEEHPMRGKREDAQKTKCKVM